MQTDNNSKVNFLPWSISGGKPPTNTFLEYVSGRVPLDGKLALDELWLKGLGVLEGLGEQECLLCEPVLLDRWHSSPIIYVRQSIYYAIPYCLSHLFILWKTCTHVCINGIPNLPLVRKVCSYLGFGLGLGKSIQLKSSAALRWFLVLPNEPLGVGGGIRSPITWPVEGYTYNI